MVAVIAGIMSYLHMAGLLTVFGEDTVSGELVLRPAVAATDCGCLIEEGAPQAIVDREAVCDHCAPCYDVADVRDRRIGTTDREEPGVCPRPAWATPS